MNCIYCGTELVVLANTPNRDYQFGGVLRACPVCSPEFIGRIVAQTQPVVSRPKYADRGKTKRWDELTPQKEEG